MKNFNISDYEIGFNNPCFIIAEAGVNHNGNYETAIKLIDIAVEAKVDAIKFQTFIPEKLVSIYAPKAEYQKTYLSEDNNQLNMLKSLCLSKNEQLKLKEYCNKKKIIFLSTPFDEESVDFLDELGVLAFKLGSGEVTNLPFIKYVSEKNKPIILSTGMSYLHEVSEAVSCINDKYALLHCVSNYPAKPENVNLNVIKTLNSSFNVPIGYSDHTLGTEISLAAVSLGACIIEKHFTLSKSMLGPDHQASLEPKELSILVKGIRNIENSLGSGIKEPQVTEFNNRKVGLRSLTINKNIQPNTILTKDDIEIKRPGTGIKPKYLDKVIGMKTFHYLKKDQTINWEIFKP